MSDIFTDNTARGRFEMDVDGAVAFADYKREGRIVTINHVEAPDSLRGTGAAGRLMQAVVDKLRADDMKIVPVCGYAAAWLRKHSEYNDLIP